jgi:hypothetical protein
LIQELSWQETPPEFKPDPTCEHKNPFEEREQLLEKAKEWATKARDERRTYEPLQHYVRLREAVLRRQQGQPRSREHQEAHDILNEILQAEPMLDHAIRLGALAEQAKLHLEAKEWSEYFKSLERMPQVNQTKLWEPFSELLQFDAEDTIVRGIARVNPNRNYQRWDTVEKITKRIEEGFNTKILLTDKDLIFKERLPYAIDISLIFSFSRILLGSPNPDHRGRGIRLLQQGEDLARGDSMHRQASIAQLIRWEYADSGEFLPTSQGICHTCGTNTTWEWYRDAGLYVCTSCNGQPISL